ncbi:MAG: SagB/ThcOx family dehydrogenase [Rubrivivax sp.]|nr:SagB/ThcOx family dehydrogenase [Rubrivivax sp.]
MPSQLMWVMLPIVLAGAWVAWRAARGRLPSRPALNALFSVMLAFYVLITAGLGIFWVANQHLPVFDWHYVFGYAMLVLLAVHLAFNLRALLAQWRRLREHPPAPATPARPVRDAAPAAAVARRPAIKAMGGLWLLGVGASSGLAYVIGLRHGRTELHLGAAGAPAGEASASLAVVEQFHAHSSHSRAGLLRRAASTDWGDAPPPFKRYPGRPWQALGEPGRPGPGLRPGQPVTREALAALLWHTTGVSLRRGGIPFRSAPSSGALFATELYVAVADVDGLRAGLWHYDPDRHGLHRLTEARPAEPLLPMGAAAAVWASALFRRSGHKYGDRTYRYVLADLGHALENLRACAAASGLALSFESRFDEARVAEALGLDAAEEGVLALALIRPSGAKPNELTAGAGPQARPGAASPQESVGGPLAEPGAARSPDAGSWRPAALGEAGVALGLTTAIHRATSLQAPISGASAAGERAGSPAPPAHASAAAGMGRASPQSSTPADAPAALALPRLERLERLGEAAEGTLWSRIATRRSQRRFSAQALPLPALARVLDELAGPGPLLSASVRVDVVANAVEGLPSGSWRLDAPRRQLLRRTLWPAADIRARAQSAGLDQEVIGDAQAVIVLSIARSVWAVDAAGPARGYRHAFLEAGLVGERVYLAAASQGLGVCAVGAFFDEELAVLTGVDTSQEWVIHLAALGLPA